MNTPIETMRGWLVKVLQNKDLFVSLEASTYHGSDAARIRAFLVDDLAMIIQTMQELKSATELYPPLSFVQIMRLLVDVYLLIMPVVLVDSMYISADPPISIQVVPVLACFLLTLLYNGLMQLVNIIRMVRMCFLANSSVEQATDCDLWLFCFALQPFGDRIDQFHVSGALIIMDQKIFTILTQDVGEHLYGRELRRVAARYDRKHYTKNMKKLALTFVEEEKPVWEEIFDSHHNAYYYYNTKTKESLWVSPKDVKATYIVKTPANKVTKDFMELFKATVKIQSIFRRKLSLKNVAVMLKEKAMLDAEGGD